ncbi:MAG TPA: SCO family protein [Acidimicrobiales bacterium]|nr:SCO family protein [Acidimicrobiales bacterium]
MSLPPPSPRRGQPPGGPPPHRRRGRSLVVGAVLLASVLALAACGSGDPPAPPAALGNTVDLSVPPSIAGLRLVDQNGRPTDLAAFRGRVLLLAPFLTSCQEVCPITTGALLAVESALRADHLGGQVAVAELTVDPDRDQPARLAAFQALSGSTWPLLTAEPATLASFWHHFGIYYQKVPEAQPAGIDWQTGRPYTYDVDHFDGFMVFDRSGRERFLTGGMPDLAGRLDPRLRALLDSEGRQNLAHPGPARPWTVSDALGAVAYVLGRPVPPAHA